MTVKERTLIAIILFTNMVMVMIDLITDASEGVSVKHVLLEGTNAIGALIGLFLLIRGSIVLKHSLAAEKKISSELQAEAEKWRLQSKNLLIGLSNAIDDKLTTWKLTDSEKEVAFLLLKGFSLKEIADIQGTTEKTARNQSITIYTKSGLAGRSELTAFFLEDLLLPHSDKQ